MTNSTKNRSLLEKIRSGKSARIGALMRILGLLKGLPDDALPPPPPPIVEIAKDPIVDDPRRRSKKQQELAQTPTVTRELQFLMKSLAEAATRTENEAEAAAFIGSLLPLAARRFPQVSSVLLRSSPNLLRGLTGATRILRQNPATRPLVRTLPTIVNRTAANLNHQLNHGKRITPKTALRSFAYQTYQMLNNTQSEAFAEIEHMAKPKRKDKQMTAAQKAQIMRAIRESLAAKEHTKGARGSTKNTHEEGIARRINDKWKRAQRVFQDQGFQAALADARR
jgi:hypothetical protein